MPIFGQLINYKPFEWTDLLRPSWLRNKQNIPIAWFWARWHCFNFYGTKQAFPNSFLSAWAAYPHGCKIFCEPHCWLSPFIAFLYRSILTPSVIDLFGYWTVHLYYSLCFIADQISNSLFSFLSEAVLLIKIEVSHWDLFYLFICFRFAF